MSVFVKNKDKDGIINIKIDRLSPRLIDRETGNIVDIEIVPIRFNKPPAGWKFDWSKPQKQGYRVYALRLKGDIEIQGLTALRIDHSNKAVEGKLLESAPQNVGYNGKYKGVGAHLIAHSCLTAQNAGYDLMYFDAKSELVKYYHDTVGAVQIGSSPRMIITGKAFERIIEKYYGRSKQWNPSRIPRF